MDENNTLKLAEYCLQDISRLPAPVAQMAKISLLDTIGCMIGGARTEVAAHYKKLVDQFGGNPQATIFGMKTKTSVLQAVYLNGAFADILDYEDTFVVGHPGATVIPSALNTAELVDASGPELLAAIVVGYEVASRVALAVKPSSAEGNPTAGLYYYHGFGAAAAAGRLLKLSVDQMEQAFGIMAAHIPLPIWLAKWGRPLHWIKNNFGGQAVAGFIGALYAREGFVGPRDILDNPLGFWRMVGSDRYVPEEVTAGLGEEYLILKNSFKPYSCCRWLHTTLDAIKDIVEQNNIGPERIEKIDVYGSTHLQNFAHYNPYTLVDVQFSLPYSAALFLSGLPPGEEWFLEKNLKSPTVKRLVERIEIKFDRELDNYCKANTRTYPVLVEIQMDNGDSFKKRVNIPRGDPRHPLSEEELYEKYAQLTAPSLGREKTKATWDMCNNLERMASVKTLTESLI